MTFEVNSEDYNEEFFAQHRKMLQVDNRASRGARFRFTSDWSYNHIMESSVHDLEPADPFERTCPSKENTNFVLCADSSSSHVCSLFKFVLFWSLMAVKHAIHDVNSDEKPTCAPIW